MKRIAIFASGSGTNAENIIKYFEKDPNICIDLILTNNKKAFVIERAKKHNIDFYVFDRSTFNNTETIKKLLIDRKCDLIVLAGFLWLIPEYLTQAFPQRIINIHPALLPNYGGKGMFGMNVHKAVIEANEKESGITIHYVNEKYDEGQIIFQDKVGVSEEDSPESLAAKIHELEYKNFPKIIANVLEKLDD